MGKRNGADDLPPNSTITIEAVTETDLENDYIVSINGDTRDMFESSLRLLPGQNATDEERLAYQQNNDVKALRTSQANAVSTGLVAQVMPFVALIVAVGVVGFVAYNSDRKKKAKSL